MVFQYKGFVFHETRRSNVRRISLSVRRNADYVALTVPPGVRHTDVLRFLDRNLDWLNERAPRVTDFRPVYADGEEHCCMGTRVILGRNGIPSGPAFVDWRQRQLESLVRAVLPRYAALLRVQPREICFKKTVSTWGTCRPRTGMITFSTNLAMVPRACVEFVVAHELCHFHHPDHSKGFYDELTSIQPDWEARMKILEGFDIRPRPGLQQNRGGG